MARGYRAALEYITDRSPKNMLLHVRLSSMQHNRIKAICRANRWKISDVIRIGFEQFISTMGKTHAKDENSKKIFLDALGSSRRVQRYGETQGLSHTHPPTGSQPTLFERMS